MFSNGERSLVGDLFGLLSAMSYGLFTGCLPFPFFSLIVDAPNSTFASTYVVFLFRNQQSFLRSLEARKEKELMFRSYLDTLDFVHL